MRPTLNQLLEQMRLRENIIYLRVERDFTQKRLALCLEKSPWKERLVKRYRSQLRKAEAALAAALLSQP